MCCEVNTFCAFTPWISRSTSLSWSPSESAKLSSISVVLQPESRNAITCCFPVSSKTTMGSTSTKARPPVSQPAYADCRYYSRGSTAWRGDESLSSRETGIGSLSTSGICSDSRFAFARSINFKSTSCTRVWWRMSQFSTLHLFLLRHLLRRWPGNRQLKHSLCSSTTFSFSLVNIPWKRLQSCKVWLVDWWIGHFFVPQPARKRLSRGSCKQLRLGFVSWLTPINFRCIWTLLLSLLWHPSVLWLTNFCLFL